MANRALELVREDFDPGDPWGSIMGHRFAICYALLELGENVPSEWEFRPGMETRESLADSWPDRDYFNLIDRDEINATELLHAGMVLARYAAILERMGKSY